MALINIKQYDKVAFRDFSSKSIVETVEAAQDFDIAQDSYVWTPHGMI